MRSYLFNFLRREQGFTLIEMVMTIVILGIIAMALAPFLSSAVTGYADTRTRTQLTADGRLVLERISRELREAEPLSISLTGATDIQFSLPAGILTLTPQGSTYVKTYTACNDVAITLNGTNLEWDVGADGAVDAVLMENVSNIAYDYTPGSTIRSGVVAITLDLTLAGETIQLYREAHIRNTLGTCP